MDSNLFRKQVRELRSLVGSNPTPSVRTQPQGMKNVKKKKRAAVKEVEEVRGFTVVNSAGKRPYLPVPGGITEVEANRLAAGLVDAKAVPIDQ